VSEARLAAGKLVEYIEAKILSGDYRPGDGLPSVRRLAGKFGLSYSTAYRTLAKLADGGTLLRDEAGAFRAGRLPPAGGAPTRKIGLVIEGMTTGHSLTDSLLLGIRDVAAGSEYELDILQVHPTHFSGKTLTELGGRYDGLMLLNSYDRFLTVFECACPAVGVMMQNSYNGRLPLLNIDPVDAARQAVNYFLGKAHRVVIISSPAPAYRIRAQIFRMFWEEIGGEAVFLDGWQSENYRYDTASGYFFSSDTMLQMASEAYENEHGVRLAADHAVLGVDGKRRCNPDFHEFPSIGIDWRELGHLAAEELFRQFADPLAGKRSILLTGTLREKGL
jgi:DNA-binding LacI/PurR family transcriptional regulator